MALPAGPKSRDAEFARLPVHLSCSEFSRAMHSSGPYAWQRSVMDALTEPGHPQVAYVQVPRKNGKSRLAADVALYMMAQGKQVFLIADSERNLKSALFFELCTLVRQSEVLSQAVLLYKDHLECPSSGGQISLRPNNLSASQSINPDGVIMDEVHMQKTDSIWNGMLLAGDASEEPLLLGITTPGYETVSLANDLYTQVKSGATWGVIFEAPMGCALDDEAALLVANPILVERPELLERFRYDPTKISEHDYRRFRLGQWTVGATAWLPTGAWAARRAPAEYSEGERLWVGFDGSYSGDSTALVACNAAGHVKVMGAWENPTPTKRGWRVPRAEVQAAVRDVMERFEATLFYDPPYWQSEGAEWDREWPGRVVEWPTNSPARIAPACSEFEARVLNGDLTHDGDRRLEAHVSHCTPKMTSSGVVVVKPSEHSPAKIDLAIAAIIAVSEAVIAAPVEDVWCL